ncbi:hypothetical protein [Brevibacillus agri]|nr:hypothetical protein [Brevibacillus agri]MED4571849.1 hypothetical protein [Brevibacillus agri]WHX29427.1 hypothetical protein QNK09_20395 [Brevibacillus agri]
MKKFLKGVVLSLCLVLGLGFGINVHIADGKVITIKPPIIQYDHGVGG